MTSELKNRGSWKVDEHTGELVEIESTPYRPTPIVVHDDGRTRRSGVRRFPREIQQEVPR